MSNILYAIAFCIAAFLMWMSIIFSCAEKKYSIDQLFSTDKKAVMTYLISSIIAIVLTIITYILFYSIQNYF